MTSFLQEITVIVMIIISCSCNNDIVNVAIESDGSVKTQYPELPINEKFEVLFENKSGYDCILYWVNSQTRDYIPQANMAFPSLSAITTFPGHVFVFALTEDVTATTNPSQILYTTTMSPYIDVVTLLPQERMDKIDENEKQSFYKNYYLSTGKHWRNYYPRNALSYSYPKHVQNIGQIINLYSNHTQYHTLNDDMDNMTFHHQLTQHKALTVANNEIPLSQIDHHEFEQQNQYILTYNHTEFYRSKTDVIGYKLEVLCTAPVVIRIFDFLSDTECDHIISLGKYGGMLRSTVAETQITNLARTSSHMWIQRDISGIVDNVVNRIGDVVDIDGSMLFTNKSSEDLQLVHYRAGEYYREHHDYGTDSENNRYITLLLYLNDVGFGGNTSFSMADKECRDHNGYFGVKPIKGSALFFYDMLEDANVDVLTLHEAEPPVNGSEKWMTNLWIWDPYFQHQFGGY